MKRKKSKTTKPIQIFLTSVEKSAVSCALDFMLHYKGFIYDETRFSYEDASSAAWKTDSVETAYKRREIRAISAAVEFSLQCLLDNPDAIAQVAEVFPELIPDLKESKPILESLRIRFAAYAAKQAQKK